MPDDKLCARCGRRFEWRRKWADDWENVKYCSQRCRRSRPSPLDTELEAAILDLLDQRARGATICPSEAARLVYAERWRDEMERTRQAARRLVAAGRIQITQRGRPVDPSTARGPIRLRALDRVSGTE